MRHIIAYFSINIRWHSQNVSASDSRKWLIKHLFPPSSCKKQINKQNSYLLPVRFRSGIRHARVQTFFAGSVCTVLFIILIYKLHYIILWLVLSSKIYMFYFAMQSKPITTKVGSSNSAHSEVYSIHHYVIQSVVSDLRQVDDFLRVLRFPPPIKIHCHDITEILLKVTLSLAILTLTMYTVFISCHALYLLLNQCVVHDYEMKWMFFLFQCSRFE